VSAKNETLTSDCMFALGMNDKSEMKYLWLMISHLMHFFSLPLQVVGESLKCTMTDAVILTHYIMDRKKIIRAVVLCRSVRRNKETAAIYMK
jgi:hypothetical protein